MTNISQPVCAAHSILNAGGTLIDVRPAEDYKQFHPFGSVSLPLEQFFDLYQKVLPDKHKPVGVSCATGHKSSIACMFLRDLGYEWVYDLGGDEKNGVSE